MDVIRRTFNWFSTWMGWNDELMFQEDDEPTAAKLVDETAAENDLYEDKVINTFLDNDATADFVFNTDIENVKTCRYIAIHPKR